MGRLIIMASHAVPIQDPAKWNQALLAIPFSHLLQSWEWGALKEKYGWHAERLAWLDADGRPCAAAQVLRRRVRLPGLPLSLQVLYCPKGPVFDWSDDRLLQRVLDDLTALCEARGVIQLKIDPDLPLGFGYAGDPDAERNQTGEATARFLRQDGWRESREQIQFRNTLTISLQDTEETLLANMKQKTRYNIRLASRRGVAVRPAGIEDLDELYRMFAETSIRDRFAIRNPAYYADAWGSFVQAGLAQPLVAEVEGKAVAGLIVYRFGDTAWYLYGMSRSEHREKMPNHLLQWEAMRWAKQQGCSTYDLWGAPDNPDPGDPMWGVYRFKLGLGARLVRTLGAWDYTERKGLYWLYSLVLPRILAVMRSRGRVSTRRFLD
jgi:lipid II:glycine glycyltransferase (peptidoglycan interpeptide bridge formation enzyme)